MRLGAICNEICRYDKCYCFQVFVFAINDAQKCQFRQLCPGNYLISSTLFQSVIRYFIDCRRTAIELLLQQTQTHLVLLAIRFGNFDGKKNFVAKWHTIPVCFLTFDFVETEKTRSKWFMMSTNFSWTIAFVRLLVRAQFEIDCARARVKETNIFCWPFGQIKDEFVNYLIFLGIEWLTLGCLLDRVT